MTETNGTPPGNMPGTYEPEDWEAAGELDFEAAVFKGRMEEREEIVRWLHRMDMPEDVIDDIKCARHRTIRSNQTPTSEESSDG